MLISLTVKNWMSFRDETEFSMLASKERQHGDRVARVKKYGIGILPVAVLYGGNASGKSNFVMAIDFAKFLVTAGMQIDGLISMQPFMLSEDTLEQPSCFKFTLLIADQIYEYSFEVTRKAVLKEKLVQVNSSSEKILYSRDGNGIEFGKNISEKDFLEHVSRGTRDNVLFLTNSVSQNVKHFRMVYDWFNSSRLVTPEARFNYYEQFISDKNALGKIMNELLPQLDTGISSMRSIDVPIDSLGLTEVARLDLEQNIREGGVARMVSQDTKDPRFTITREKGSLAAKKLVTCHKNSSGYEAIFEPHQESDGTNRLLDLLPAFIDLDRSNGTKLYAIDEIDRSLHTLLVEELIELYLAGCSPDTRKQLFFTTHNVMLMDQKLFRRDEMWLTERDSDGASKLFPFSDFKGVRHDKDVRRSYLQGRFGGIPDIADVEMPSSDPDEHAD